MVNPFDLKTVLLAKHAQHVVLIHFPIALFISAAAFDVIGQSTKSRALAGAAYYNLLAAALSTLPAIATGLLAWQFQLEGQKLQACGNLLHSVQTGSPAFDHVFGTGLFDYLQQNADAADTFNKGMSNLSSMLAYAVLMAYDFTSISSIVDIGGGEGRLLRKILEFNPQMRGAVLDMPATIETASQELRDDVCGGRCSYYCRRFLRVDSTGCRRVPSLRSGA